MHDMLVLAKAAEAEDANRGSSDGRHCGLGFLVFVWVPAKRKLQRWSQILF
jgi:hypothetical protein